MEAPAKQPNQPPAANGTPQNEQPQSKGWGDWFKNNKTIVIIIIIILIIAIWYFWFRGSSTTGEGSGDSGTTAVQVSNFRKTA